MLTTLNLKVGSILHDMELNIDHRVIYMNKDYFVTILINGIKEKTEINEWHIQTLQHFVNKKQIAVREPKFDKVFDFDSLPEKTKKIYLRNKDIVESVQNDLLEGRGLITQRHDSNHHRHAVLTLDDIWVFVINQTIAHNMMTMSQYPMTKEMLEKSVHPIPLELWDYGCTKYGAPRPIVNLDQFEYSIRKEVRARITRKGIEWNGLYYIANDPWLAEQITKTRRSSVPLKCRLDERNIGSLWYIADNRLVKATLNENRAGNYEFNGMSLRNYEEYKTKKKELVMEKAQEDQEIRCARRMGMQATLDDAVRVANQTAPNDDKTKNIRHNRKEESILVLEANSIGARLNTDDAPSLIPLKNGEPEPEALSEPESNEETGSMTFEEALQKIKQKM